MSDPYPFPAVSLRQSSRRPDQDGKAVFDFAIDQLQAQAASLGTQLSLDANVRRAYARKIGRMASDLTADVKAGRLTWAQAAEQANEVRNLVMKAMRGRSSPFGRAAAEALKMRGKSLNELIARKTMQIHGNHATFDSLGVAEKNAVYADVVRAAGQSNPRVTLNMHRLSSAGRGLVLLSLAISTYHVATAEDKVEAIQQEGATTAAGIGGGIAGGALAGLACGPGAPACVAIGAFVGGAAAALGVSFFW